LPHFRPEASPSAGDELQSEYFVPRERACEALRAIAHLRERLVPLLHVCEVRSVAADELWLSPCYRRDSVGIHFTWKRRTEEVQALLPVVEKALEPFEVRPHWGKLFALSPECVRSRYERIAAFRRLVERYDPDGRFRNPYLDRYVGASAPHIPNGCDSGDGSRGGGSRCNRQGLR